jgi:ribonuclease HI
LGCSSINPEYRPEIGSRIDYIHSGKEKNTTNNRMELTALLCALDLTQTKYKQEKCIIKSDSAYCVNMFNQWIYNWHQNDWVRPKNQSIENLDLVKQI